MNHAFDTKALELSRQAIALFFEPMPGVQLQAKIQNLFIAAMEFAAPAVQEGQPVSQPYTLPEWIPCSERMPEDGEHVIVFHPGDGVMQITFFFAYGKWWDAAEDDSGRAKSYFTHWMPLPAPPFS